MIVKRIKLRNFRNFDNYTINFDQNLNIITGNNGQGKTNLLESLVFLSTTHSHRIQDDQKLIKKDKEVSNIDCLFVDEIDKRIGAVIHSRGKSLLVNNHPISKSSDFIGLLNVILFSPNDINIFSDSPRERRKLVNIEITKVNKKYLYFLNLYQKLLKERNLCLKKLKIDDIYIDTLNEKMIEYQAEILSEIYKFINIINKNIDQIFKNLIGENINLEIEYLGCVKKDTLENMKVSLKEMYRSSYEKDKINQITNYGIHRDDLVFKMNGDNINNVASQGQRRLAIMAFKIALITYVKEVTNKVPILLLDDVLSELDLNKQSNLLSFVSKNIQTIITTSVISKSLLDLGVKLNIQVINNKEVM